MAQPRLSILICTLPERKELFEALMAELLVQSTALDNPNDVEFAYDYGTEGSIGAKRNNLLRRCSGEYVVFIDDDDFISTNYLGTIYKALESKPDCVEMRLEVQSSDHLNGAVFHYSINHGLTPKAYQQDVFQYPIMHVCPVKTELARKVLFPNKSVGEDLVWARRLKLHLSTMATIGDDTLYFYRRHP